MNRLKAISVLVALGSIAIVAILITPLPRATPFAPKINISTASVASMAGVTCTLVTTTTEPMLGNQSFETAFVLANYHGLSLVPTTAVPPGTVVQVPAHDDYYVLANPAPGYTYNVEVIPANLVAGNYNLVQS